MFHVIDISKEFQLAGITCHPDRCFHAGVPPIRQEAKQKAFGSPEEAMKTLAETVKAGDTKGVMAILGPEGQDIISSGDEVADKNALEQFVKAYQEKSRFRERKQGRVSIIIGSDHWPFRFLL